MEMIAIHQLFLDRSLVSYGWFPHTWDPELTVNVMWKIATICTSTKPYQYHIYICHMQACSTHSYAGGLAIWKCTTIGNMGR